MKLEIRTTPWKDGRRGVGEEESAHGRRGSHPMEGQEGGGDWVEENLLKHISFENTLMAPNTLNAHF